jgi:hypothetical protein
MDEYENSAARAALLEAVDNQLRDGDPPETRTTLERLLREGHSREQARRMIAFALVIEMNAMIRDGRNFDHASYAAELDALPQSVIAAQAEDNDESDSL